MIKNNKRIVLVLCTKNEERTVVEVIKKANRYVDKILVVDANSKDRTVDLVRKQSDVELLFDTGKGKGEAIRLAIDWSKENDILVFMDADGSHKTEDIENLINEIKNGYDLAIASRGKGGSDELSGDLEKCIRLIGSTIITMIINLKFKSNITDSQNGFRAIKASVAKKIKLKENGFSIEQEMLMKSLKNNYKVCEIPSHEFSRKYGCSNINLAKEFGKYLISLIRGICC